MTEAREDQMLHFFCLRWAAWHRSRRLFAPPLPKNMLVRLQPQRCSGEAPDANCSRQMSLFNLAIMAQPESEAKLTMQLFYLYHLRHIKVVAKTLGISRKTFYERIKKFRRQAYEAYLGLLAAPIALTVEPKEEAVA